MYILGSRLTATSPGWSCPNNHDGFRRGQEARPRPRFHLYNRCHRLLIIFFVDGRSRGDRSFVHACFCKHEGRSKAAKLQAGFNLPGPPAGDIILAGDAQ